MGKVVDARRRKCEAREFLIDKGLSEADARKAINASSGCLFCGRNSMHYVVFYPSDMKEWGAPEGKIRFVPYGLCGKCAQRVTREQIENTLMAQLIRDGLI